MKRIFTALLALLVSGAAFTQSKTVNDPNAQPRAISGDFSAVSVSSGIELYLSTGSANALAVSVPDGVDAERILTEVKNGVMEISVKNKFKDWKDRIKGHIKVYLSAKSLSKIVGTAGSRTMLSNELSASSLTLKFASGATFNGKVAAGSLAIETNSGAVMDISGSAASTSVDASSGAIFRGFDLSTETCNAEVSSGAAIRITINKELTATASSGGGIRYKGSATIRDINVSSGGLVKRA